MNTHRSFSPRWTSCQHFASFFFFHLRITFKPNNTQFSVNLLGARTLPYVTTIQLSVSGNLTFVQYCYPIDSPKSHLLNWQECPSQFFSLIRGQKLHLIVVSVYSPLIWNQLPTLFSPLQHFEKSRLSCLRFCRLPLGLHLWDCWHLIRFRFTSLEHCVLDDVSSHRESPAPVQPKEPCTPRLSLQVSIHETVPCGKMSEMGKKCICLRKSKGDHKTGCRSICLWTRLRIQHMWKLWIWTWILLKFPVDSRKSSCTAL